MKTLLATWIVATMQSLQPVAPWLDSYPDTAAALERAATADPLYKGSRGVEQTVDVLLSLGWFESRFDPHASGDHGASIGLFQIAPTTAGLPRFVLEDQEAAARTAIKLIRQSFQICREYPVEERLAWYTHGGPDCSPLGVPTSRHRMQKAMWLFQNRKAPVELASMAEEPTAGQ